MFNQGSAYGTGSYLNVQGRILQRLQSARIKDQVFTVVKNAYDQALDVDHLVLSRVEKKRLLADVMRTVLVEMSTRLDES